MFSDRKDRACKVQETTDATEAIPHKETECFHIFKILMGIRIHQLGFQIIDKLPSLEFALG